MCLQDSYNEFIGFLHLIIRLICQKLWMCYLLGLQNSDIGYTGFLLCVYKIRTMGLQDSYTWFIGFLHLVYRFLYWLYRILIVCLQNSYIGFTVFLHWVYRILTLGLHDSVTDFL